MKKYSIEAEIVNFSILILPLPYITTIKNYIGCISFRYYKHVIQTLTISKSEFQEMKNNLSSYNIATWNKYFKALHDLDISTMGTLHFDIEESPWFLLTRDQRIFSLCAN